MTDEERTTAGGQPQRSDGEDRNHGGDAASDEGSDKPKKDLAKTKSMYGAGIKSRMSIGRASRRSVHKQPVADAVRQPVATAITGEAAVALDDLFDGYYRDLRSSVRPPDPDAARPTDLSVAAGRDGGPTAVRDRLRDVHDAMADIERALDAACGSLSAVRGSAGEWVSRRPRSDGLPKPRADRLGMKVYRTKTDGIRTRPTG